MKCRKGRDPQKNEIARSVVDYVTQGGGRFLDFDKENKRFFRLPEPAYMEKVMRTIRSTYVPVAFQKMSMVEIDKSIRKYK